MKKYLNFIYMNFKMRTAYLSRFFILILSLYVEMTSIIYIWLAIFKNSNNNVYNYTNKEMIVYLLLSFSLFQIIYQGIDRTVSYDINSGDIVIYFTKPISYIMRLIFQAISNIIFNSFFLLPPLIISIFYLDAINFKLLNISLFFLSIFLSSIIVFLLDFMVGLSAFFVNYIWGFLLMKEVILRFVSGQLFPLSFLPNKLQNLLSYLPFSHITYSPIMILFNKMNVFDSFKTILIQIIWIIILYLLVSYQYKLANTHLSVNGG